MDNFLISEFKSYFKPLLLLWQKHSLIQIKSLGLTDCPAPEASSPLLSLSLHTGHFYLQCLNQGELWEALSGATTHFPARPSLANCFPPCGKILPGARQERSMSLHPPGSTGVAATSANVMLHLGSGWGPGRAQGSFHLLLI